MIFCLQPDKIKVHVATDNNAHHIGGKLTRLVRQRNLSERCDALNRITPDGSGNVYILVCPD